jgi:glucan 1,3-beta-glucosidase
LTLAAVAFSAPVTLSAATLRGVAMPSLTRLIGPREQRSRDPLTVSIAVVMLATLLVAVVTALGLVFDPRYRDIPFAPLTAAVVPFLTHSLVTPRPAGTRAVSEMAGAVMLAVSVPYIALNEGLLNWQSLWLCGAFIALIVSLVRVRDAQS